MPYFVARALGSTLLLLVAESNVEFTGKGFWSMALGSIQWAVGRVCGKGLDGPGYLLERLMWVLHAEEEVLDIGCRTENSRKKTVLKTKILHTLIVRQHRCEDFVVFGCEGIVQ
jgi:hypothetical protein